MDLLLRLYEPRGGTIRLDGEDVATLDPSALRAAIGVVAADGTVFRGTLADNIRYKQPAASAEDVREAALAAGLETLLRRLPEGLEAEIGDAGVGLSVGERQRLQLARVLVSKPRVLVLDEATANLDYATEQQVRTILFERAVCPTTLVIAHRYSMVQSADHVVVIDDGRVVAEGSPQAVRRSNEWFARFAASSAAG
jgi:ABC-type multidrug transport system fused ATPase/permease subunit